MTKFAKLKFLKFASAWRNVWASTKYGIFKGIISVEREKFPTYHKLTHHTIEFTKYSQLQNTTYYC